MLDTMARQGEYSDYARVAALDPATGTPPGAAEAPHDLTQSLHRVSGPLPGAVHDLTPTRIWGIVRELAACGLVVLADKGYTGAGEHVQRRTRAGTSLPHAPDGGDVAWRYLLGRAELGGGAASRAWRRATGRRHRWARGCARAAPRTDRPPGEVSAAAVGPPSGMRANGGRSGSCRIAAARETRQPCCRRAGDLDPRVAADGPVR
jgi:hypothetical protein